MKWCRFQSENKSAYGIIEEDTVVEVSGTPFGRYTKTADIYPLSSLKLLVPVIPPTLLRRRNQLPRACDLGGPHARRGAGITQEGRYRVPSN